MKIQNLMRIRPKVVKLNTPLDVVWNLLSKEQIHILPVLNEENQIKGIIAAEDLLMNLVPDYREFFSEYYPMSPTIKDIEGKIEKHFNLVAKDIMNKKVIFVNKDQEVFKALSKMLAYNVKILPVIDEKKKLFGILVEKDIIKYLFKKKKHIFKKLKNK